MWQRWFHWLGSRQQPEAASAREIERREANRHVCKVQVSCQPVDDSAKSLAAECRDISTSGINLILPHRLEPGTLFDLELHSVSAKVTRRYLMLVVHSAEQEAGRWSVGAKFYRELDAEELKEFM
jgi:hypothetical protein